MIFKWKDYRNSSIKDKGNKSNGHSNEKEQGLLALFHFDLFIVAYCLVDD